MPKHSTATIQDIRDAKTRGLSIRRAAAELGLPVGTVTYHWPRDPSGPIGPAPDQDPARESIVRREGPDGAVVEFSTRKRIRTVEDALAHAEVDLRAWYVHHWETTDWEMGWTKGSPQDRQAHVEPLHRVKLHLKRLAPRAVLDGLRMLRDDLADASTRWNHPAPPAGPQGPSRALLEIDLFDVHFGKLAWAPETGESYDLDAAEHRFAHAVEDLLGMAAGWSIDRILFPVGNDLFHVDNRKNMTTNGTVVDVDSRYAKIWRVAKRAALRAVDRMLLRAPVDILWVPGNHDHHPSFHLVDVLGAWYRDCPHVTVDDGPSVRKLYRYGANLIGFQHGDTVKGPGIATLPDVLTAEALRAGIDLREIRTREFHLGHRHTERTYVQRDVEEIRGCRVRWLSALSGADFWHHENLFVGNSQAATAHVYGFREGHRAQLCSTVSPVA